MPQYGKVETFSEFESLNFWDCVDCLQNITDQFATVCNFCSSLLIWKPVWIQTNHYHSLEKHACLYPISRTDTHTSFLTQNAHSKRCRGILKPVYIWVLYSNDPMVELQIPGTKCDRFYFKSNRLFTESVVHKSVTSFSETLQLSSEQIKTICYRLFLFLTLKLLYQQIKENERMLSMRDL